MDRTLELTITALQIFSSSSIDMSRIAGMYAVSRLLLSIVPFVRAGFESGNAGLRERANALCVGALSIVNQPSCPLTFGPMASTFIMLKRELESHVKPIVFPLPPRHPSAEWTTTAQVAVAVVFAQHLLERHTSPRLDTGELPTFALPERQKPINIFHVLRSASELTAVCVDSQASSLLGRSKRAMLAIHSGITPISGTSSTKRSRETLTSAPNGHFCDDSSPPTSTAGCATLDSDRDFPESGLAIDVYKAFPGPLHRAVIGSDHDRVGAGSYEYTTYSSDLEDSLSSAFVSSFPQPASPTMRDRSAILQSGSIVDTCNFIDSESMYLGSSLRLSSIVAEAPEWVL